MTSTADPTTGHPIVVFVDRLHTVLDGLGGVPAWSLTRPEQQRVLLDLARERARLDELWLRVLASADRDDVADQTGATSTATWLAAQTRQPVGAAHADVTLAAALDTAQAATRDALAAGDLQLEQARVVVHAVQTLPAAAVTEDPTLPARAEAFLLHQATTQDAKKLRLLARHLLDVLDPDDADQRLGRRLEAEEAAAARATYLHLHDNGDGTHTGRFKLATLHTAILTKALDALLNPARHTTSSTASGANDRRVRRSRPELLGEAFAELLERLPADRLPTAGGTSATIVVTLDHDQLLTGLGTAHLDTGEHLSAGQARRLACEAGVIPTVLRRLLDGTSLVLDMGRTRRLHTEHQRIALALQQGGCTAEGCDRPPGWTQTHHDLAWTDGGDTNLTNGRLLCPHHHRKAHSTTHHTEPLPNGKLRFHRRT
jgi:hypothetical protein